MPNGPASITWSPARAPRAGCARTACRPTQITFTGFPLPPELLGGRDLAALKRNLAARLARLDPKGMFREAYGDEVDHFLAVPPPRGLRARPRC